MFTPLASASTSSGCAYSRSIRSRTRRSRARSRRCCTSAGRLITRNRVRRAGVPSGTAGRRRRRSSTNNAGYGLFGALEELPAEELRREFETNVFGALNVTRAALPQLRRQRSGHIVQISSLEGIAPIAAGEAAYAAT